MCNGRNTNFVGGRGSCYKRMWKSKVILENRALSGEGILEWIAKMLMDS
jgi:hypothetical protein